MSRVKQSKSNKVGIWKKKKVGHAKKQENMTCNENKYQSILNQLQFDTDIKIYKIKNDYNSVCWKINWRYGWYEKDLNQISRDEDCTIQNKKFTGWP